MAAICAAAPLALANQLPLPTIVQHGWSTIEESDLYLYLLVSIDRGWHHFLTHSLAVNPNAKFCAAWSNRCGDMAVFNFSRWRLSTILDFQKWEILTAPFGGAKMRHRAKFCADRSRRCGDMAVLDLLYACLDHPRSVFWWSLSDCHCVKFGLNRCSSFDNMQVLIF